MLFHDAPDDSLLHRENCEHESTLRHAPRVATIESRDGFDDDAGSRQAQYLFSTAATNTLQFVFILIFVLRCFYYERLCEYIINVSY